VNYHLSSSKKKQLYLVRITVIFNRKYALACRKVPKNDTCKTTLNDSKENIHCNILQQTNTCVFYSHVNHFHNAYELLQQLQNNINFPRSIKYSLYVCLFTFSKLVNFLVKSVICSPFSHSSVHYRCRIV